MALFVTKLPSIFALRLSLWMHAFGDPDLVQKKFSRKPGSGVLLIKTLIGIWVQAFNCPLYPAHFDPYIPTLDLHA